MEALFEFILVGYGLTFLIVYGSIFENVKKRIKSDFIWELVSCTQCTGFWIGFLISFYYGYFPIFGGAIISGVCFLISRFVKE